MKERHEITKLSGYFHHCESFCYMMPSFCMLSQVLPFATGYGLARVIGMLNKRFLACNAYVASKLFLML